MWVLLLVSIWELHILGECNESRFIMHMLVWCGHAVIRVMFAVSACSKMDELKLLPTTKEIESLHRTWPLLRMANAWSVMQPRTSSPSIRRTQFSMPNGWSVVNGRIHLFSMTSNSSPSRFVWSFFEFQGLIQHAARSRLQFNHVFSRLYSDSILRRNSVLKSYLTKNLNNMICSLLVLSSVGQLPHLVSSIFLAHYKSPLPAACISYYFRNI